MSNEVADHLELQSLYNAEESMEKTYVVKHA